MKAIKQAAILYNGVVFKGDRHRNIISNYPHINLKQGTEGFITSRDYEKSNCRWATSKEQARNKRNSRFISLGEKSLTAAQWAELSGTGSSTIIWRIKKGWDVRRAIYGNPVTSIEEISQYLVF